MKYISKTILLAALFVVCASNAAERPKLVINIVVSSMREADIDRYASNLSQGGLLKLSSEGTRFSECYYDYQQTLTPVSLATLTTGAMPSTHGIVGSAWRDYVENREIELIKDTKVSGLDYHDGGGNYSPRNLIAPTITETLRAYIPDSRTVTVALDPISAVVMNGGGGMAFWLDDKSCCWSTSSYYMPVLADWIKKNNREKGSLSYLMPQWVASLQKEKYINKRYSDIVLREISDRHKGVRKDESDGLVRIDSKVKCLGNGDAMKYTPAGNTATIEFAKSAMIQFNLGADKHTDMLNICLDTPRSIIEAYGPESIEAEDMYYRLDRDIAELISFAEAQVGDNELLIVFTSDHGSSPSYDFASPEVDRFNVRQFEVILNGFLSARYGQGSWVLEYLDKSIYLNHNMIYEKGLDLSEVQNEAAVFAMQFRGISHALSSTAMRTSYFGSGYARKMQNSFYPRRSGDVIINLMPGWIEERDEQRSRSGSMYGYDTHVPLIFYGKGIEPRQVSDKCDMTSVAPTISRLLNIGEPSASEGSVLQAVTEKQTSNL